MASMDMPEVSVAIDRLNLPFEEEARMDAVHDYFSDHLIQVNDTPTQLQLSLQRSNYDYCEDIGVGLGWLGVGRDDVRDFYIPGQQSFLCLLESWIPYGWSMFLAKNNYQPNGISILHFDDHKDMMSPKIGLYGTDWKDMLTHASVDMGAPETIKQAVLSGAITLGSMMTPLLHHLNRIDVFHLAHGVSNTAMNIDPTTIADYMLEPGRRRMAVDISSSLTSAHGGVSRYLRAAEIAEIANAIHPKMDIFLHIDMDYFNNRYNGSDEWRHRPARNDQPLGLQKENISRICDSLVRAGIAKRISHVSIGISPSFYPSEYWEEAITYLIHGLVACGLPATDLLKYIETARRNEV